MSLLSAFTQCLGKRLYTLMADKRTSTLSQVKHEAHEETFTAVFITIGFISLI